MLQNVDQGLAGAPSWRLLRSVRLAEFIPRRMRGQQSKERGKPVGIQEVYSPHHPRGKLAAVH